MNIYLEKIAKLIDGRKIVAPARKYMLGGKDEMEALRYVRALGLQSLKSIPKGDAKKRAWAKGAFKDAYRNVLRNDKPFGFGAT